MPVCCHDLLRAEILIDPTDDFSLDLDLSVPASSSSLKPTTTSEAHSPTGSAPATPTEKEAPAVNAVWHYVLSGSRRRPRRWLGPVGTHLASDSRTLSHEQGNKLLVSRFRGDQPYICDWPGCVHVERCRYMVFWVHG
jgi:hypothetical protein